MHARRGVIHSGSASKMQIVSTVNSFDLKTGLKVKEYTSITTAATALGISRLEISQCCRGLIDSIG